MGFANRIADDQRSPWYVSDILHRCDHPHVFANNSGLRFLVRKVPVGMDCERFHCEPPFTKLPVTVVVFSQAKLNLLKQGANISSNNELCAGVPGRPLSVTLVV